MRVGETVELRVEALAFGGDSIGHAPDGRVVFFAGGAPGDLVLLQVEEVKPRFARAKLVEVLAAGASRVTPRCALAGRCGGCQWQEASLDAQRAAKQAIVERALAGLGAHVEPIVVATPAFAYRSRARLTSDGRGALGFQARRSHDVLDVPECPLLDPALQRGLFRARRRLAASLPAGAMVAGLVGADGRVHLAVSGAGRAASGALVALAADDGIAGVVVDGEAIGDAALDVAEAGEPPFSAAADGFAQASHEGNRVLRRIVVSEARRLLDGVARPRVLELYAGDGNFTRDLSTLAAELCAVEGDARACARLRGNVAGAALPTTGRAFPPSPRRGHNRPLASERVADEPPHPRALPARVVSLRGAVSWQPLRVIALDAAVAVRQLADRGERFDLVVLDPPRAGATHVAPLLATLAPRILYVSCDPMTLARDARLVETSGLAPRRATPIDLMPQTSHVEVVCAFEPHA